LGKDEKEGEKKKGVVMEVEDREVVVGEEEMETAVEVAEVEWRRRWRR
jgi:hypothetical protein